MPPESSPAARRPAGRALRRLLALALGLGLALLGLEGLLRAFAPQPKSWLEIFQVLPEPLHFGLIPGVENRVDTGDSGWTVRIDPDGRRISARAQAERERAAASVPVIGDSFVFGHGVDFEDSFVGLLNAGAGNGTLFRNEGVPAYGPIQYRFLLERDLAESAPPRALIVVSYLGNDFFDCVWDKHAILGHGTLGDTGGLRSLLKRQVHLYRLCSRLWHTAGPQARADSVLPMYRPAEWTGEPLARAKDVFESEFRAMRDACAKRSIPLLVVLLPPTEEVRHAGGPAAALQYDLPTRMAQEILERLAVPFVSASPALAKAGYAQCFLPVDGHFSRRGAEVVRDCIQGALQKLPGWKR